MESNELIIKCNKDGIILDVCDFFLTITGYEIDDLQNKFIGIIMSPFLSYIHSNIIFPKYNKLNYVEKKSVNIFISGLEAKRPMIIYDKNKNPLYVNISVKTLQKQSYYFQVNIELIKQIDNTLIYTNQMRTINNYHYELPIEDKSEDFKLSKNKIVVISIDFRNSTEFLVKNGTLETIYKYKKFHNEIINLIKKKYYPYIYIHEIIGDCFVIVSNIDWALNIPKLCASLVMSFLMELYTITNKYIKIRIGISYNNLYWGYIDDNLRLFGIPMNLASRLENICIENSIMCDNNFLNKLKEEKMFNTEKLIYNSTKTELKGFGDYNYNIIPLDSKINLEIFNIENITLFN